MSEHNPFRVLESLRSDLKNVRILYADLIKRTFSKENFILLDAAFEKSKAEGEVYTVLVHNLFDYMRKKHK